MPIQPSLPMLTFDRYGRSLRITDSEGACIHISASEATQLIAACQEFLASRVTRCATGEPVEFAPMETQFNPTHAILS